MRECIKNLLPILPQLDICSDLLSTKQSNQKNRQVLLVHDEHTWLLLNMEFHQAHKRNLIVDLTELQIFSLHHRTFWTLIFLLACVKSKYLSRLYSIRLIINNQVNRILEKFKIFVTENDAKSGQRKESDVNDQELSQFLIIFIRTFWMIATNFIKFGVIKSVTNQFVFWVHGKTGLQILNPNFLIRVFDTHVFPYCLLFFICQNIIYKIQSYFVIPKLKNNQFQDWP